MYDDWRVAYASIRIRARSARRGLVSWLTATPVACMQTLEEQVGMLQAFYSKHQPAKTARGLGCDALSTSPTCRCVFAVSCKYVQLEAYFLFFSVNWQTCHSCRHCDSEL